MDLIKIAEQAFAAENPVEHPSFNTGDTISVHYKKLCRAGLFFYFS